MLVVQKDSDKVASDVKKICQVKEAPLETQFSTLSDEHKHLSDKIISRIFI